MKYRIIATPHSTPIVEYPLIKYTAQYAGFWGWYDINWSYDMQNAKGYLYDYHKEKYPPKPNVVWDIDLPA